MRIVVNTNRIIAALIRDSSSRKIIMSGRFELITPRFSQNELQRHREEITAKAKITSRQLDQLLGILLTRMYIAEDVLFAKKMNEAKTIIGNTDENDEPFIALALAVKNDGIWTDDKHFLNQKVVKVHTTADLINLI